MSDSDTTDSDSGIRFKTTSTRYKSESVGKHSSSSKSSRSTTSSRSNRRSRDRDRDRDRDRGRDRRRSSLDRSRSHHSRSRSRSRDRRKRRERDRRSHRSRSKSRSRSRSRKSPRPSSRRLQDKSNEENKNHGPSSGIVDLKPSSSTAVEPSKIESNKILDISVSSLSSQEEAIEKEDSYFGPALPPALDQQENKKSTSITEDDSGVIGPSLPPHLIKNDTKEEESSRVIGPTMPAILPSPPEVNESSESELSPFSEEEPSAADDDDFIGPMPGASGSRSQLELEQRALELKLRHLDSDRYDSSSAAVQSREDWMLELPDIRKVSDMGLGARQFRTREKLEIGDRSVWTDTPSDRERKKAIGHSSKDSTRDREQEEERRRVAERDKEQEDMAKRHKKKHKRDKTLLELHQKKAKKEKKKKDAGRDPDEPTRRPFDRNIDLHANRFDEAQKKAIFKKAQLLDTRFSSGASKYL